MISVRTHLAYTCQVQGDFGWTSYIHTDDMEEALECMEEIVASERLPARVIENYEDSNILQEMYPRNSHQKALSLIDFDWRQDGF